MSFQLVASHACTENISGTCDHVHKIQLYAFKIICIKPYLISMFRWHLTDLWAHLRASRL